MKDGILYGVGVGPGDPELLTCKAVRIIRQADVILVVKDGKIVESGRHEELMAAKGYYYNLYTRQFQEESINQVL